MGKVVIVWDDDNQVWRCTDEGKLAFIPASAFDRELRAAFEINGDVLIRRTAMVQLCLELRLHRHGCDT